MRMGVIAATLESMRGTAVAGSRGVVTLMVKLPMI